MAGLGLSIPEVAARENRLLAGYALALDFRNGWYRSGALLVRDPALLPGYSYGRAGAKSEPAASGSLVPFAANVPGILSEGYWARGASTNLFLNSGTGVTQNVAVTAQAYTLSFFGTGSIALSGASTAGPLVGTGAGNRVALTFTPGAGTLTLTVSGSCTGVGLVAGILPGPVIVTAGAAATVAADDMRLSQPVPADEDWVLWGAAVFAGASTGTEPLFSFSDGTNNNRVLAFRNASGALNAFVITVGSAATPTSTLSQAGAGRAVLAIRHMGGSFTVAAKNGAGSVALGTPVAKAYPGGMGQLGIGGFVTSLSLNALLEGVFYKRGTVSDGALTSLLQGA